MQWEQFATGGANKNIVVNQIVPEPQLLTRLHEIKNGLLQRNRTFIIDAGVSFQERMQLYSLAQQETGSGACERPDHSPLTTSNLMLARGYWEWQRVKRFMQASDKLWRLRNKLFPTIPLITRLFFGYWALAWNDVIGSHLYHHDNDEYIEQQALAKLVTVGMTVMDIGANQGIYTLLCAALVGKQGRVISFEPSPRECQRLRWNIMLNRCRNVTIEPLALGNQHGKAELFVCLGKETGCNSLRVPSVNEPIQPISIAMITLDQYVKRANVKNLDVMKIDVEGAELDVFKGGHSTIAEHQPMILCELADARTAPWGYHSNVTFDWLVERGYHWFSFSPDGHLIPCPRKAAFHENLLAIPGKKIGEVAPYIMEKK